MPPERDPKVERAVKFFINGVNVMKAIERNGASCSKANIYDIVKLRGLVRKSDTSESPVHLSVPPPPEAADQPMITPLKSLKRRLDDQPSSAPKRNAPKFIA